ncbi:Uncharacterised protein [Vibrio cholerae]|uniref:Uncharacterized protein n=2 Tax=Vibrio cholerae TaxID=666 RepID=A0A655S671_VIBCL|nr:Uncharacterised protein [Vibrio cholerae]CSA83282.1 Uncharacterised protein [Vibrio cholerae]CSA84275.1 Uncharacterised protein [Vibrio cholerae]CSA86914.1 Uncharacterised protein [Vibrio cholerae]CSA88403.1 Uncharacterised protein [Vibrio cholerae]
MPEMENILHALFNVTEFTGGIEIKAVTAKAQLQRAIGFFNRAVFAHAIRQLRGQPTVVDAFFNRGVV